MQQPKHIFKPFKNRNKAIGTERRLNAAKTVLNHQPHFPKSVTYEDIDQTIFDWVNNELELHYENKRFPTYKLFSNQRISEYGQNWKELDEKGNLEINFKTITRESNPQKGNNQGNNFNIPGDRYYPIFKTNVLEENGDEVVQIYSMKQPYSVDFLYTVTVFTSSYKILNEMNMKMQSQFKGLEKYIFPNGFPMPMLLNSIGDESDYQIDDRKYYAQTYQIKLLAYIINEDDYKVQKIPSRIRTSFVAGENSKNKINIPKFNIEPLKSDNKIVSVIDSNICENDTKLENIKIEPQFEDLYCPIDDNEVIIEDYIGQQICWKDTEDELYVNKKVVITINITPCNTVCEFELDSQLEIETIEMNNVKGYKLWLNSEEINIEESDVSFDVDDIVKLECVLKNNTENGKMRLVCYDPTTILDKTNVDAQSHEEIIV